MPVNARDKSRTSRDKQGQPGTTRDKLGQAGTSRDKQGQSGEKKEQCTVEKKEYCAQLSATLKINLELKIKSQSKYPFLNVFSKTYRPTKVNVLGNWEVSILFRNSWRFFFVLYPGPPKLTPFIPEMASKLTSSYLTSNFHELPCPLVEAFNTFPAVS